MATKHENTNKHLFYLNELSDYKVASDDPDVRGWPVKDKDNRVIGKVDNLLVNKNTERVVYLDVEVDNSIIEANHDPYGKAADDDIKEFINKEGENHIIVPVGLVRLNEDQNFVYTDRIDHRTFAETKRFEKGATVNREYEVVVLDTYNRDDRTNSDRNRDLDKERSSYSNTGTTGDLNNGKRSSTDSSAGDRDGGKRIIVERASTDENVSRDRISDDSSRRFDDDDRRRSDSSRNRSGDGDLRDDNTYRSDRDRTRDDDDRFYDRREFDRTNYRRNKD